MILLSLDGMNLELLYEMYGKRVFNLALHYVLNVEDAEEITQDVFVTLFQKRDQFREEAHLATWIYRITVNKALDFCKYKARKKRWWQRQSLDHATEPADFNHPGADLEDRESVQFIFRCIDNLNEQQRTALILHKIEGFSQQETAEIMKISTKAVESLVQRAKMNLKKRGITEG